MILVLDEIEFFFDTLAGLGDTQLHGAPRRSLNRNKFINYENKGYQKYQLVLRTHFNVPDDILT